MNIDQVMQIVREAIEPVTPATGGRDWWLQLQKEGEVVVAAPSNSAATTCSPPRAGFGIERVGTVPTI